MAQIINPDRLKQLRTRRKLSQKQLAEKARPLNPQTIYRLEKGRASNIRKTTIEKLCKALGVEADVLSGEKPIPAEDESATKPWYRGDEYQLNVRVDGELRNAFSLVALRYQIPIARIVKLAALLFVLTAEQSLERRRSKLAELEALRDRELELVRNFPHLPASIYPSHEADDAIRAEKKSIAARDIFGSGIPDDVFGSFSSVGRDSGENPFVIHLEEAASEFSDIAEIVSFGDSYVASDSYEVCREDAIKLAGGDEALADRILMGWVQLHEMPSDLLKDEAAAERMKWMRSKVEATQRQHAEADLLEIKEMIRDGRIKPSEGGTGS